MISNEFCQVVSVDFAPHGSVCEWCGKPAEHQYTAIGGVHHNDCGTFCKKCGEEFARDVVASLTKSAVEKENFVLYTL